MLSPAAPRSKTLSEMRRRASSLTGRFSSESRYASSRREAVELGGDVRQELEMMILKQEQKHGACLVGVCTELAVRAHNCEIAPFEG